MADSTDQWSDLLRMLTRKALENNEFVPRDNRVYFKHVKGRFGTISLDDLLSGTFRVIEQDGDREFVFSDVDDLIRAGWALD